jgi:predicted ferric reductase
MIMFLNRTVAFFAVTIFFALAISLLAFNMDDSNAMNLTIRLLALNGYISLSIAAVMTPFLKEITLFFKRSFITVHHYFAAAGLLLITLHPIAVAINALNPRILLPNFASLYSFLLRRQHSLNRNLRSVWGSTFTLKSGSLLALLPRVHVRGFVFWSSPS